MSFLSFTKKKKKHCNEKEVRLQKMAEKEWKKLMRAETKGRERRSFEQAFA